MYKLIWVTTPDVVNTLQFPTFEDAEIAARATLLDANGIKGNVWPNHPALADADDRLYCDMNTYAAITKVAQ